MVHIYHFYPEHLIVKSSISELFCVKSDVQGNVSDCVQVDPDDGASAVQMQNSGRRDVHEEERVETKTRDTHRGNMCSIYWE